MKQIIQRQRVHTPINNTTVNTSTSAVICFLFSFIFFIHETNFFNCFLSFTKCDAYAYKLSIERKLCHTKAQMLCS